MIRQPSVGAVANYGPLWPTPVGNGHAENSMGNQVNIDIIKSFAEATVGTFDQMCSAELDTKKPYLKDPRSTIYGLSAVVGLTGDVAGVSVLTLPEEVAMSAVGAFVGEKYDKIDSAVVDGVKELINIIAGMAKAKLDEKGYQYNFGLPKVVVGYNYITDQGKSVSTIVIPFGSPFGEFFLEVTVRLNKG